MFACAIRRSRGPRRLSPPASPACRVSRRSPACRRGVGSFRVKASSRCRARRSRLRAPSPRPGFRFRGSRPCRRRRSRGRADKRLRCRSRGPRRASAAGCLRFPRTHRASRCRRRANKMKRLVAAPLLLLAAVGCASQRARPKPPEIPVPPVAAAPPAQAPPPALPPTSVGPRTVPPSPPPPPAPAPAPMPPPPSTAPPVPPAQRGRFVVLNFDNADIETMIQAASEIIGFNYVLAPDVRGKVTVQTSGRIAQEEVFGVLLAILEVQGFTAVKAGNLYKILRIEGARERAVPTIVGPTADPNRTSDEIITQIVPIKYSAVADLSALLRPLISTRGTLIAHRETNVLIITDTSSNVTRLLDIIRLVDVQVAQEELQIIPVTYADSAELATILTQLFASGRIRSTAPGTPPAPTPPVPTPGVPTPPAAGQPGASAERAPLVIPERRSNSLIVHAKKHEVETIRRLVSQLDVNIYGGRRVFIYYAENAKSKDLATTLNSIYGAREGASGGGPGGGAPSTPGRPPAPPPTTPPPPPV